jgi:hypothetical protein
MEVSHPMIETISKISGIFKASIIPLFFLTMTHSVKDQITEEKTLRIDDKVPGDNFPNIKMPQDY